MSEGSRAGKGKMSAMEKEAKHRGQLRNQRRRSGNGKTWKGEEQCRDFILEMRMGEQGGLSLEMAG